MVRRFCRLTFTVHIVHWSHIHVVRSLPSSDPSHFFLQRELDRPENLKFKSNIFATNETRSLVQITFIK